MCEPDQEPAPEKGRGSKCTDGRAGAPTPQKQGTLPRQQLACTLGRRALWHLHLEAQFSREHRASVLGLLSGIKANKRRPEKPSWRDAGIVWPHHSIHVETEVQRDKGTCLRSYGSLVAELSPMLSIATPGSEFL